MLVRIYNSKITKTVSVCLALLLLSESFIPVAQAAPTVQNNIQAENLPAAQAGDSEYVDLYTGDFKYNIPLMAVPGPNGGYPLNLSYNSNVGMETEASWVGLGWNLNIGAISRELRGLPDDYDGENVVYENYFKPYRNRSITFSKKSELFGYPVPTPITTPPDFSDLHPGFSFTPTFYWNNYYGFGYNLGFGLSAALPAVLSGNLGLNIDSQNGIGYSAGFNVGLDYKAFGFIGIGAGLSFNGNTRTGLNQMSFSYNYLNMSKGRGYNINQPIPQTSMPVNTASGAFGLHFGRANYYKPSPISPTLSPFGYYGAKNFELFSLSFSKSDTEASPEIVTRKGIGYLNMDANEAVNDPFKYNAYVKDFNRAGFNYNQKIPNLPPAYITPDNFIVSGQGMGGTFKACKENADILNDATLDNYSSNNGKTLEAGLEFYADEPVPTTPTNYVHVGTDRTTGFSKNSTGSWHHLGGITLSDKLDPQEASPDNIRKEGFYFKMEDEVNGEELTGNYYDAWQKDEAVRPKLKNTGDWLDRHYVPDGDLTTDGSTTVSITGAMAMKKQRQVRNTQIYAYTRAQSQLYGREKNHTFLQYVSGDLNDNASYVGKNKFTDVYSGNYQNQISEINVVNTEGTKYVFGLPVYTHIHKEHLHSTPDAENTTKRTNDLGVDEFNDNVGAQETDQTKHISSLTPYPTSWLLTSLMSDDYVDLTQNGLTNDDYGYWVKFNYRKIYTNYKWRNPVNGAYHNGTKESSALDNISTFSYGENDLTYINEIETKTHVAKFYISVRKDGYEAHSEFASLSGLGSKQSCKLDSIKLYIKEDYLADPETASALQTVVFEYDYSLCDNYAANGSGDATNGKLTLKKLYVYTENSKRGMQSPYVFTYKTSAIDANLHPSGTSLSALNNAENPNYDLNNADRWGFYTPNTTLYGNNNYPYAKTTYTEQDNTATGSTAEAEHYRNTAAWTLKEITNPTGALMKVRYESDSYAFVEQEYATEMIDVVDHDGTITSASVARDPSGTLYTYTGDLQEPDGGDYKVYFKKDPTVTTAGDVQQKYIRNLTHLYYKVKIEILNNAKPYWPANSVYDYVSGYAKIKQGSGYCGVTGDYAWITVESEEIAEGLFHVHPFRKAAWQYLKLERPDLLYDTGEPSGDETSMTTGILADVFSNLNELRTMISGGYYTFCLKNDIAANMYMNGLSKIKLCTPDQVKYGGGSRVKKILIDDNWREKTTSPATESAIYGEEYFYDNNGDGTGISSGVTYEPELGGDESALLKPIAYDDSHLFRTSYDLFMESPILKALYPSAGVGYGKVTVRSIAPAIAEASSAHTNSNAAPYTVYEHYTAKNFPVLTDETDLSVNVPNTIFDGTYGINAQLKNNLTRSQGYSIVTNDMPGKLKRVSTYKRYPFNEPANFIGSSDYIYHTNGVFSENATNTLNNKLLGLKTTKNTDGTLVKNTAKAWFGIEEEIYFDFNENSFSYNEIVNEKNLDLWLAPGSPVSPYPVPVPTWYKSDYAEEQYFRHVTCMKVIRKTGVLKEVINNNQGAVSKTENIAYDFYTGEPVLTKTTDQFKQTIYQFNYKGYWNYAGMGGKYAHQNQTVRHSSNAMSYSTGALSITGVTDHTLYFSVGDALYVDTDGSGAAAPQTVHVNKVTTTHAYLQTATGAIPSFSGFTSAGYVTTIDPAAKNMWDVDCGGLIARNTEIDGSGNVQFDQILDAGATTFKDEWPMMEFADCSEESTPDLNNAVNPFVLGLKGIWRPSCSYKYLTTRGYEANQPEDGFYDAYTEFSWQQINDDNWKLQGSNTIYSPYGFLLESKKTVSDEGSDDIYTSVDYNSIYQFTNATCSNAEYSEFYFNSFEQANLSANVNDCKNDKMDWSNVYANASNYSIANDESHTGKKALKVNANQEFVWQCNNSGMDDDHQRCETCFETNYYIPQGTYPELPNSTFKECSSIKKMYLKPNGKYQASAWVKATPGTNYTYTQPKIEIYANVSGTYTLVGSGTANGEIIEGWQRIYFDFTMPGTYTTVQLRLKATGENCWFDDFRIQPYNSEMQCYVYDLNTLKIRAVLDGENFATFYGYDQAGVLQKMRKETTGGIKTISETRGSVHIH